MVGRETGRLVGVVTSLGKQLTARFQSREVFLALGSLSFLLAVLVVALPAAWLPPAVTLAGDLLSRNRRAILLVGVLTGAFGVWALYQRTETDDGPTVRLPDRPPEFAYFTEHCAVGESIDRATSDDDLAQWEHGKFRRETHDQLYEAAVTAISEAENCVPQIARNALAEGTWTDSPRAAQFLGEESETELPLSTRLRDWASGEQYRRHVHDTVEAIAAIDPEYDGPVVSDDDTPETDDADPSETTRTHTSDVELEAAGERV